MTPQDLMNSKSINSLPGLSKAILIAALLTASPLSQAEMLVFQWETESGQKKMSDTIPSDQRHLGYKVVNPMTGQTISEVQATRKKDSSARKRADSDARHGSPQG